MVPCFSPKGITRRSTRRRAVKKYTWTSTSNMDLVITDTWTMKEEDAVVDVVVEEAVEGADVMVDVMIVVVTGTCPGM